MMHPPSAITVKGSISTSMSLLASRLTCLEIHFDGGSGLLDKMLDLSDLARLVFLAATNLQALHVGFPSRAPLDLRLDFMFHNTRWEKLRTFGIQAWRLEADEIIHLIRRHSKTLKGLRLRDVQLKDGGFWKDVLSTMHEEMDLDWVSLRRIDYADHFDAIWEGSMEVPDEPHMTASDSGDEDDTFPYNSDPESAPGSNEDESVDDSDQDTDHGPDADEFALSPNTPTSQPFCTCSRNNHIADVDDLGDNGNSVTYQQRKMWEKWVCGRCPEHSLE